MRNRSSSPTTARDHPNAQEKSRRGPCYLVTFSESGTDGKGNKVTTSPFPFPGKRSQKVTTSRRAAAADRMDDRLSPGGGGRRVAGARRSRPHLRFRLSGDRAAR